ncbi:MAG: hypothetical protein H0W08_03755 [Acidobacteria bacterium]|nr:hypothetical protein [Acidobacteriota bacterium]
MRLPSLMDEVMEKWKKASTAPYFKAEYIVHHNGVASLQAAAKATSARLKLGPAARERTMAQYVGYTRELSGPGVKPVPTLLFTLTKNSHDHTPKVYEEIVLPAFRAISRRPGLTWSSSVPACTATRRRRRIAHGRVARGCPDVG